MKIKTILCLCLIVGMAAIQLSAQVPVLVRTKSNLTINVRPDLKDVYQNDKQVDSSKMKVTTYDVLRFKHRKLFWENRYVLVESINNKTDEAFTVKENSFKQDRKTTTSHFYLIGKQGTTYLGLKKKDWLSNLR
jgi:uncharacterized linocin/CFP29 family protein